MVAGGDFVVNVEGNRDFQNAVHLILGDGNGIKLLDVLRRQIIMHDADYRKINDRSNGSSTYHKKDGTNVRAILKEEARAEVKEGMEKQPTICPNYNEDCKKISDPFKCMMSYPSYVEYGECRQETPITNGYCPLVKSSKLKTS